MNRDIKQKRYNYSDEYSTTQDSNHNLLPTFLEHSKTTPEKENRFSFHNRAKKIRLEHDPDHLDTAVDDEVDHQNWQEFVSNSMTDTETLIEGDGEGTSQHSEGVETEIPPDNRIIYADESQEVALNIEIPNSLGAPSLSSLSLDEDPRPWDRLKDGNVYSKDECVQIITASMKRILLDNPTQAHKFHQCFMTLLRKLSINRDQYTTKKDVYRDLVKDEEIKIAQRERFRKS